MRFQGHPTQTQGGGNLVISYAASRVNPDRALYKNQVLKHVDKKITYPDPDILRTVRISFPDYAGTKHINKPMFH
jgi:hypothetical protein